MDFPYTKDEVAKWFTTGTYTPAQDTAFTSIHDAARALAVIMIDNLPPTVEAKIAMDRLQEAVTWSDTAVSRGATS